MGKKQQRMEISVKEQTALTFDKSLIKKMSTRTEHGEARIYKWLGQNLISSDGSGLAPEET